MGEITFRPARIDEAATLEEMTLAGVRHWGHHENSPDAYAGLVADMEDHEIAGNTVFVLEDASEVIGFYELVDRGDHVELLRMFQKPELIGSGLGRMMWEHCLTQARLVSDRMLIISDPGATGFYEKMGAVRETTIEPVPGFELGVYWYDLTSTS